MKHPVYCFCEECLTGECSKCGGTGVLPKVDSTKPNNISMDLYRDCEKCHGTGKVRTR